ncbi:MAG: LysM peptidoglycan-binding domain-containing protein [Phycisphaeraceae bacterium]|nr:LysM peptidoglycan-binding domain-containing protein [Phycisphaeraceae bacterium]
MTNAQKIAVAAVVFLCLAIIGYFVLVPAGTDNGPPVEGTEVAANGEDATDSDPTLAPLEDTTEPWRDPTRESMAGPVRDVIGEDRDRSGETRTPTRTPRTGDLDITDADMADAMADSGVRNGRNDERAHDEGRTAGGDSADETEREAREEEPRRTDPTTTRTTEPDPLDAREMDRRRQEEIASILVALNRATADLQRTTPGTGTGTRPSPGTPGTPGTTRDADRPGDTTTPRPTTGRVLPESHTVVQGDSLTAISQTYYGSARYWRQLVQHNPDLEDPDRLRVGQVIKLPPYDSVVRTAAPTPTPTTPATPDRPTRTTSPGERTHTVAEGDNLWKIAEQYYGEGGNYQRIFEANRVLLGDNPNNLRVGQVLVIPPRSPNMP